jgi:hypothetical protein
VLKNLRTCAGLRHPYKWPRRKQCQTLPMKQAEITRKRHSMDLAGSALSVLVKLPDVKLPDPSQARLSIRINNGGTGCSRHSLNHGTGFGKTDRGPGLYSRPATSNTSKTTTTKPSPPLG